MNLGWIFGLMLCAASAQAQEMSETFFVWNGDQAQVLGFDDGGNQWTSLGNRHDSECVFEVQKVSASVGQHSIPLPSGRTMSVYGITKYQAKDLWVSCMGSKGWERVASLDILHERLAQLRAQGIVTSGMGFERWY